MDILLPGQWVSLMWMLWASGSTTLELSSASMCFISSEDAWRSHVGDISSYTWSPGSLFQGKAVWGGHYCDEMLFAAEGQGRITHYDTFFSSSPAPLVSLSTFHISMESCHFHPFSQLCPLSFSFILISFDEVSGICVPSPFSSALTFLSVFSFVLFTLFFPLRPCPTWKALLPPSLCLTGGRRGGTARLIFLWSKALPLMSLWALYPQSLPQRETKQD